MSVIYGLTEVCGVAVSTSIDDPDPERTTTIGTPLAHVEAKVADTVDRRVLAIGESGEQWPRGHQVMHGYLDLPEATAETLDGDGGFTRATWPAWMHWAVYASRGASRRS
jgi:long-subunit acyl-CoA synthetase (AMP-forming)